MNATVTCQEIKNEQNEDSILETEDGDGDNDSKIKEEFNYTEQPQKAVGNREEEQEEVIHKVQNNGTKVAHLRKSDRFLTSIKNVEYDSRNCNLEDSSNSWKHCDNAFIDEDVCTMVSSGQTLPSSSLQITSIDGFFNRKRGRPPKNRFVEVYKNTHQKPQAIFTSFKLEKHGKPSATSSYENSYNSDGEYNTNEYQRYKPNTNSTHRKRLNKVNSMISPEIACFQDDSILHKRCKDGIGSFDEGNIDKRLESYMLEKSADNFEPSHSAASTDFDEIDNLQTTSLDSVPSIKKQRIYESDDHVTVVRASGTFYPENSSEKCADDKKVKENKLDLWNDKQSGTSNEVAENLSLKDVEPHNKGSLESPVSCSINSSTIFPQIYNVLQMQQQLFAFYHQMALMSPVLSHLDLNNLLLCNSSSATKLDIMNTFPSTSSESSSTSDLSAQNKDLLNMILNLKKHQANQKKAGGELLNPSKYVGRIRSLHKRATSSTTISSTSTRNPNCIAENSVPAPDQKLSEPQFTSGKEKTPPGYLRFRFNEDCGYNKCGYRQHQSHFHCNRPDCQYSFCDKTRFVQHTARHERLDTLMGSDFQQYRATMSCNYSNCPYAFDTMSEDSNDLLNGRKSSHFHCLKCQFVCADTNKVVAHRRLHDKMEFIRLAGFRKVSSSENCKTLSPEINNEPKMKNITTGSDFSDLDKSLTTNFDTESHCPYAMRHVHYHCLVCNSSVLSRSQLLAHKHRSSEMTSKQSSDPGNLI